MTDAEINRRLALAIGWKEKDFIDSDPIIIECEEGWWNKFDYRDPAVIWSIAERYNCFPVQCTDGEWVTDTDYIGQDTATKAVALAVIKAHEGGKE